MGKMLSSSKRVKGYGQHIWRDEDKYYLVLEEGTVASWLVVYELPQEFFYLTREWRENDTRSVL